MPRTTLSISQIKKKTKRTNRIHHWYSVGTGKSQPEGPAFQWETKFGEFPNGTVDPRVEIFVDTEH